jgi:hypothetical protein
MEIELCKPVEVDGRTESFETGCELANKDVGFLIERLVG